MASTVTKCAKNWLLMSTAIGAIGLVAPAYASEGVQDDQSTGQDADGAAEQAEGLNVIIVTARRREEDIRDVPVTISSVGGEALEGYKLDQATDVARFVPALNVSLGGSGTGGSIYLRGVGSSQVSAAFDSAVLLNIDGIPINSPRFLQGGLLDLEQVDVLKGPQSLYFGKGATAGVMSIQSRGPGDEFEASLSASYEFEEKGQVYEGYISGPITDTFGARLALRYLDNDELFENTAPGAVNRFRGEERFDGRLTLDWRPTSSFSAVLKIARSEMENDGMLLFTDAQCPVNGSMLTNYPNGFLQPSGLDCNSFDQVVQIGEINPIVGGNFAGLPPQPTPFSDFQTTLTSLALSWDVTDNLTLRSVTGKFDMEGEDFDNFSIDVNGYANNYAINDTDGFSQELRLESQFDGPFNFILGGFYQDREITFSATQNPVGAALLFIPAGAIVPPGTPGFPPTGIPTVTITPGPDPLTGFTNDFSKTHVTDAEAFSVFGSVDFKVTDTLTVTAGARYTEEERSNVFEFPTVHSSLLQLGFLPSGSSFGPIEFEDDNFSPEVSVVYAVNEDVNLFAAYKSGFKSGGIDNSAFPAASLLAEQATGEFTSLIFDSETAEGVEFGFKSNLMAGTMRWNATIYYYVYEDLQVQTFDANTLGFINNNAGELTSQGFETDIIWKTPIDGLTVSGAIAYTDAKYTDTFIQFEDLDGRRSVRAPEWTGTLGLDYSTPISDGLDWSFGAFGSFSDEYFTEAAFVNDPVQESFATLDLSTGISSSDDRWQLNLIATNVFDKLYVIDSAPRPFAAPNAAGEVDRFNITNRGRQVFVELAFRY